MSLAEAAEAPSLASANDELHAEYVAAPPAAAAAAPEEDAAEQRVIYYLQLVPTSSGRARVRVVPARPRAAAAPAAPAPPAAPEPEPECECKPLADLCIQVLINSRADLTARSLPSLPHQVLLQIAQRSLETTAELNEQEQARKRQRRYVVDPPQLTDRVFEADTEQRRWEIAEKWQLRKNNASGGARLAMERLRYAWNIENGKLELAPSENSCDTHHDIGDVLSSALLLYRLQCLFIAENLHFVAIDGYKSVWSIGLYHRASGLYLEFQDFKATATCCQCTGHGNAQYEADVQELLSLLCNPKFTHPYDGTVAGCCA
ncbi:hypothetical protein JKP88DRAFT_252029 [Tribonema minus]|uniref:Uncharacterized protein n=1 Tax=Tribonema minus TaxID=303371 RepID=A0A835ZAE9_9STRA|nr:hypothetical protein JKP88DRAFT_252029 [Tribonema minus]